MIGTDLEVNWNGEWGNVGKTYDQMAYTSFRDEETLELLEIIADWTEQEMISPSLTIISEDRIKRIRKFQLDWNWNCNPLVLCAKIDESYVVVNNLPLYIEVEEVEWLPNDGSFTQPWIRDGKQIGELVLLGGKFQVNRDDRKFSYGDSNSKTSDGGLFPMWESDGFDGL